MAISKRMRFEVLRRDNFCCRYCGRAAPDVEITVDHVLAVALGGQDVPENLVAACADCNSGKTSTTTDAPLIADVAQDVLRWQRAINIAVQAHREDRRKELQRLDFLERYWSDFDAGVTRPADWHETIRTFVARGLSTDDLIRAIDIAMCAKKIPNHRVWAYFCGIAWKIVTEIEDRARGAIDAEALAEWERIQADFNRALPMLYSPYRHDTPAWIDAQ
jgi:hypothetical protein